MTSMTRRNAFVAAALMAAGAALANPAAAQNACTGDTLRPGDARLAAFAPPAADTSDVWMERDTAVRPVGVFTQHVIPASHGGRPAHTVVQRMEMRGRVILDSVTVQGGSWAPVRHAAVTPAYRLAAEYRDGRVRGVRADSTGEKPLDAALSGARFDFSLATLLAQGLPLREGYAACLPSYDVARGSEMLVGVRVTGAETVTLKGRSHDVWVVEIDYGGGTATYYMDRATRREVGWVSRFPDGRVMKSAVRQHAH
jgi:hypothetical protein